MIPFQDVRALFAREVRSALRERSVVVNSVLLPLVLYPLLLWIEFSAIAFASGLSERATGRLALVGVPDVHEALADSLDRSEEGLAVRTRTAGPDDALSELAAGDLDAVLEFRPPAPEAGALADNFELVVHYDRSVDRSRRALVRVQDVVGRYRNAWLDREASALGLSQEAVAAGNVTRRNVSSDEALGAAVLGLMIPFFLVISVALGCLIPAVDATAGERERGTWETLMSTQASLGSVVTAKYLYVAAFGAVAGLLNVTAMSLSIGPVMAPINGDAAAFSASLPPTALGIMVAGVVLLALFFAAAMMPFAAFARTFKDGQALVTPVIYLALLPLVLGQQSDRTLSPTLALVPVANIAMAVRDAIHGIFLWPLLGITAAVSLGLILVCLAFARWTLGFEDFLLGTHSGSPWRFLRDRLGGRRRPSEPHAPVAEGRP